MIEIANIVLPVFALLGLGYVVAWTGILSQQTGEALGEFVFTIGIPVLIFGTLARAHFPDVSPWALWFSYFTGVAVTWALADFTVRRLFGRDARAGAVAGVTASFANLVLVGIPLVHTAFGERGSVPLFILISIHLPVMMIVSSILVEWTSVTRSEGGFFASLPRVFKEVGVSLVRNPIVIGIVAGGVWRIAGLPLNGLAESIVDQLSAVASPCALFAVGMTLRRFGIRGNLPPALALSVLKMVVMPLLVWATATTFTDLPPLWIAVATIGAAAPSGINAYLIANHFDTGHALASSTITLTAAMAVVTVTVWMALIGLG